MKPNLPDLNPAQGTTRDTTLECATKLFAEKGFHKTTIADICSLARINIAAVNYYFRSKENLYQEVWRHAHNTLAARFPPDAGVAEDAPPRLRLQGRIKAMLQHALSLDAYEFLIMHKEMANPTGLLKQVVEDTIGPLRLALQRILRELLGHEADDKAVMLCEISVVGPLMHLMHAQRMHLESEGTPEFSESDMNDMLTHFTSFSLAGIERIGRSIRSRKTRHERSIPWTHKSMKTVRVTTQ